MYISLLLSFDSHIKSSIYFNILFFKLVHVTSTWMYKWLINKLLLCMVLLQLYGYATLCDHLERLKVV